MIKRVLGLAALAAISFVTEAQMAAADDTVNTGYFGGVAISGYDTVAYFTDGRAVKGSEEFSYDWLGTPWHFASRKHRDMFMSEPVKYAPQYGGYCAGEVAFNGVTVNIDPDAWRIIDGKLYLGYMKEFAADLEAHPDKWLPNAEANWPGVESKLKQGKYN